MTYALAVVRCAFLLGSISASAAPGDGERLYLERCAMCHQPTGTGVPPVYPPLAGSDFLTASRTKAIGALCEGLTGPITVKGVAYNNTMPAQILDDEQAAAVLTFVGTSWGNGVPAFTPKEVAEVRQRTRFGTFEALTKASAYAPLPTAPSGWAIREVAQLPEFCTRFASNGRGSIYLLAQAGNVYRVDAASGGLELRIKASDYLEPQRGNPGTSGITQDAEGRLWIVCNRQLKEENPVQNEITIYRTDKPADDATALPKPWFRTRYPYGIGPYNHGVSHMAFGPDGMLYVSSGSRTDGGEKGDNPHFSQAGEVEITACLWRLDPKAAEPKIEVYARGIRNAYSFAWDAAGHLFSFANGPDVNAPEEMDYIQRGRHYGFPYQFADWPVTPGQPYPHTPAAPPGLRFTLPVRNLGPAGGGSARGLSTFDAHSSPGGVIWCGEDFPEPLRNSFLMTRFGNLLGAPAAPEDVGFDVLLVRPSSQGEVWEARTDSLFTRMGRPLDAIRSAPGAVWILEYTRATTFKDGLGWLPGRILELRPKAP